MWGEDPASRGRQQTAVHRRSFSQGVSKDRSRGAVCCTPAAASCRVDQTYYLPSLSGMTATAYVTNCLPCWPVTGRLACIAGDHAGRVCGWAECTPGKATILDQKRPGPYVCALLLLPDIIFEELNMSHALVCMRHDAVHVEKNRLAVCRAGASRASLSKGSPLRKRWGLHVCFTCQTASCEVDGCCVIVVAQSGC